MNRINYLNYCLIKRIIEVIFSILIFIATIPLIIFISLLIKLSSRGPIFYRQKRLGKNLKLFNCLKFRTMNLEADDMLDNLLSSNEEIRLEFKRSQKIKNDPRVTKIGKFLRKTSLDELPQFINIIRNEMSLIGPRPIVENEKKRYGKDLEEVFSVRPGITGLWQVSGRNKLSYKRRIMLDLIYVRNKNISMDINILIRTIGVILFPFDSGGF